MVELSGNALMSKILFMIDARVRNWDGEAEKHRARYDAKKSVEDRECCNISVARANELTNLKTQIVSLCPKCRFCKQPIMPEESAYVEPKGWIHIRCKENE